MTRNVLRTVVLLVAVALAVAAFLLGPPPAGQFTEEVWEHNRAITTALLEHPIRVAIAT